MTKFLKPLVVFLPHLYCFFFFLGSSQTSTCVPELFALKVGQLPDTWEKSWTFFPPALPKIGAQDAINATFENDGYYLQHEVYCYRLTLSSYFYFRINREIYFPSGGWEWSKLEDSEQWPLRSDEALIMCGEGRQAFLGNMCGAALRYGNIITIFSLPIAEIDGMNNEGFKEIVLTIDNQITTISEMEIQ